MWPGVWSFWIAVERSPATSERCVTVPDVNGHLSHRAGVWSLRSCGFCHELRHTDEVVGGKREGKRHADPIEPAEPGLPNTADGLQPAEDLLDPFAFFLAERA